MASPSTPSSASTKTAGKGVVCFASVSIEHMAVTYIITRFHTEIKTIDGCMFEEPKSNLD
jgi:hypothetical protein